MRDPGNNPLKAWARDYEEKPFYFLQQSKHGKRLVAWTEEPEQTKRAFYVILESLPAVVQVLVKIAVKRTPDNQTLWSRFHGEIDRWQLIKAVQENEKYVFSDGMHQLCVKDEETGRYLAFDDHSIFFIYEPTAADADLLKSLGFENRYAEPIYAQPHFQRTDNNSEEMEAKFISDLRLERAHSDLDEES
ncbi:MAG TPA: hypothetical protein VMH87_04425 [Pseudomonadales bacterium]|nr:hypothetical protein [Pseudomonadales bacterium]